jgi:hypothetical protein
MLASAGVLWELKVLPRRCHHSIQAGVEIPGCTLRCGATGGGTLDTAAWHLATVDEDRIVTGAQVRM